MRMEGSSMKEEWKGHFGGNYGDRLVIEGHLWNRVES